MFVILRSEIVPNNLNVLHYMIPKRDFNIKYPNYSLTGCPLTNKGKVCSYSGFCLECPFRLLLTVVNILYDTSDSSLGLSLRNVISHNYGI